MKKIFFSLAFTLISYLGFSNNSNVTTLLEIFEKETYVIESSFSDAFFGTCYITIGFYNKDGDRIGGTVIQVNDVDSAKQCGEIADKIQKQLS